MSTAIADIPGKQAQEVQDLNKQLSELRSIRAKHVKVQYENASQFTDELKTKISFLTDIGELELERSRYKVASLRYIKINTRIAEIKNIIQKIEIQLEKLRKHSDEASKVIDDLNKQIEQIEKAITAQTEKSAEIIDNLLQRGQRQSSAFFREPPSAKAQSSAHSNSAVTNVNVRWKR